MKPLAYLLGIGILLASISCKSDPVEASPNTSCMVKEQLGFPFGTILHLEAEIINGDSLYLKEMTGRYLLKIKSVENKQIVAETILPFIDEAHVVPDSGSIGKSIRVVAYESGAFNGLPDGYEQYQEIRTGSPFRFHPHLVVIGTF